MTLRFILALEALVLFAVLQGPALGASDHPGTVRITPLGSHDGEFCAADRALVFEDPDGTRILYDAGRTVRGPADERLGHLDAILLSHAHADHLGDAIQPAANAGTCGAPDFSVKVVPSSNTVNIAAARKTKLIVGSEMAIFLAAKVRDAGGDPKQVQLLRFGGQTKLGGVEISGVPAAHSNGVDPMFLSGDLAKNLSANALTAYVGPAGGFVIKFSNGLVVYLSGDTGMMAEHDAIIRKFFHAKLAVLNIGGTFTTGPLEAAYVVNEMIQPAAVIASHANEVATQGGKLVAGSKTDTFMKNTKVPVYLPLSGKSMDFDVDARCLSGCTP
jgi:L-ascorbate metabolism protein UlaG (beta-lactamase superfamily)